MDAAVQSSGDVTVRDHDCERTIVAVTGFARANDSNHRTGHASNSAPAPAVARNTVILPRIGIWIQTGNRRPQADVTLD